MTWFKAKIFELGQKPTVRCGCKWVLVHNHCLSLYVYTLNCLSVFISLSLNTFLFIYRSTDYGSTYERMNDKVKSKTVLSYLFVCPSNMRKVRQ